MQFEENRYANDKDRRIDSALAMLLEQGNEKVAGFNFFNSIVHDKDGHRTEPGSQQIKFFTDRPLSDKNGYIEFLPASKNPKELDAVTMGEMSVIGARVLPTALASKEEEAAHRGVKTHAHVDQLYATEEEFLNSIQEKSKNNPDHKIGVMIPGFPMSHDQGIATAAALQAESGMPIVLYSWPSLDKPLLSAFKKDERKNELSLSDHGSKIINEIANRIGPENMVLIGFSQGGKMAIEAAISRNKTNDKAKPFYAQVFSRADGPAREFQANISPILNNAEHTVVFASPHDRLLFGSALMPQHKDHELKPGWRTGATIQYEVPHELRNRFQVIDDSAVNNGASNHVFNTRGISDWLKSLK